MPSGDLRLELISANGLQQANNLRFIGFKQDPYCFIKIDDQKKRSKTHSDGGSNPTWNESFTFSNVTHMSVMKVQLLDENTWTTDNYIGECVIPLDNVVGSGHQQVNAPVFIKRRRRGSNKVEVQGNLTCRLEWHPTTRTQPDIHCITPGGYWILEPDMRGSFKERYSLPDYRKPLGKGSYGETHRVIHRQTGREFACKIINKASIRANRMETDMQLEIKILNHLYKGHANIINVEEVVEDEKRIYVVMELCTGGELYDHIVERADNYSEADAAAIICTILDVVRYCHNAGVVHRDLKPENFLFTKKGSGAALKAIDFGLGQFIGDDEQLFDVVGSPYYIAPEVLRAKPGVQGYGKEVDVWSCGVILYILLCGQPPFIGDEGGHEQDIHRCILTQKLDLESPPWNHISRQAKTVVAAMLHRDPRKRAKVEDLLRDQWITGGASKNTIRNLVVDRMRSFAQGNQLRRKAIFMIARELPQSEVEGLRKLFMEMDEDGNGVITIDEMRRALRKMGSMLPTTELEEIMKLADANGDNTIDWQEFIAAIMNHSKVLRRDRIQRVFEQLDRDGSGFLDRDELASAFRELNVSDLDDAMRQADQNQDGSISFEEFFEFMTREM